MALALCAPLDRVGGLVGQLRPGGFALADRDHLVDRALREAALLEGAADLLRERAAGRRLVERPAVPILVERHARAEPLAQLVDLPRRRELRVDPGVERQRALAVDVRH